jgi:hypothetical protein
VPVGPATRGASSAALAPESAHSCGTSSAAAQLVTEVSISEAVGDRSLAGQAATTLGFNSPKSELRHQNGAEKERRSAAVRAR